MRAREENSMSKFGFQEEEREPVAYMYKTLKREYFMDEETKECSQGQARSQCRKLLGNECKSQRQ